jgi:RHS repeat-associated protein
MRYLFFLLFSIQFLFSDPYITAITENDPSTFVDGVSMITGDFYLGEEDYVVAGAEPISSRRFYLSRGGFFEGMPHLHAIFVMGPEQRKLLVNEPNGTLVEYEIDCEGKKYYDGPYYEIGDTFYHKKRSKFFRPNKFLTEAPGVSNTASGAMSAKTLLKNQAIVFDAKKDPKGKSFTLHAADGTIRHYSNDLGQEKEGCVVTGLEEGKPKVSKKFYDSYSYRLDYEQLPNGHCRCYEYDSKNQFVGIRTTNLKKDKTFAHILGSARRANDASHTFQGSDGRQLRRFYNKALKSVVSPELPNQEFTYEKDTDDRPLLQSISLPCGRKIAVQYETSSKRRVAALLAPLGKGDTLIPYYTFSYSFKQNTSSATDIFGNRTAYFWDKGCRIKKIDHFLGEDTLHSSESCVWEDAKLRCRAFYDENRVPLCARTFEYDDRGNILVETFWGNLSGQGSPLQIDDKGFPTGAKVERAVTKSRYSQDGRDLLLRREEPSGLITEYTYLPTAQLPTARFLLDGEKLFSRTFYEYDEDFVLVREATDNGISRDPDNISEVTVRTIRQITPRQEAPYIGLPDWIEERYWDGTKELLLQKVQLHYTRGALVERKDVSDADQKLRYTLTYQYSDKGLLEEETNALGQVAMRRYDEIGNMVFFKDFGGLETTYAYNCLNVLETKTEKGADGLQRTFLYSYDHKQRLKTETDEFGNVTSYNYNLFGHRTETLYADGALSQTKHDAAGNEVLKTDAKGHKTSIVYNAWKKPIQIQHPDGAVEAFLYNLDGTLKESTDAQGVKTEYRYDVLGQILEKKTLSAVETYIYDGSRLLSHTDAEGTTTTIGYDGAGRKVAEETSGERVEFAYDKLGRIAHKTEGDLVTFFQYDLLGRLKEERQGDVRLVQYDYDTAGNRKEITRFIGDETCKEQSAYDSFKRLIKQVDAMGHVTKIDYDPVINQKVQTDPLGLQTIETFDNRGRLASLEKKKDGKSLLLEEFKYDLNGNKKWQCDTLETRQVVTQWHYNSRDRLERQVEGNDLKTTTYSYCPCGERKQVCKPDGITLDYEYNKLGQLVLLTSSDGTVRHEMTYDLRGNPLTFDGITRTLDPRGRVASEIFPQGFLTITDYDKRGRKKVSTFGMVKVVYEYGQLDLESVTCGSLVHSYKEYDLSGNLLQEELLGGLGRATYEYDALSRNRQIQAPAFSQEVLEFDAVGNIRRMEVRGAERSYTYDPLYQLASESGMFAHDYTYDALHNRIQKDGESFQINALNQLEGIFEYDLNGNPLQVDGLKLTYDALDRLIRVEGKEFVKTCTYDYLNRCLSKTTNGKTVYFLYQGQNEIGSLNIGLELQELRLFGATPHAEIGAAVAIWLRGGWYAPIHDLQGNVATLLPLGKGKPTQYSYGAFGEEKIEGDAPNPWRFSSKRTDEDTGLVNYGRRYYLPKYGRWLNCDPLGFTAGANLYAFVSNDPLTTLDEYGLTDEPGALYTGFAAGCHSLGSRVLLDKGRFFCSLPYYLESGINLATGREALLTQGWHDSQSKFFSRVEEGLHSIVPIDKEGARYQTYRNRFDTAFMFVDAARLGISAIEKGAQRLGAIASKEMGAGARQAQNVQSVVQKLSTSTVPTKFKPFNERNFRENLIRLTGIDPGRSVHAHHVFPQQYRERFFEMGVNIDDPKYLAWWGKGHLPNAKAYNKEWKEFMWDRPEPTMDQILQEGKRLMSEHGIKTNF